MTYHNWVLLVMKTFLKVIYWLLFLAGVAFHVFNLLHPDHYKADQTDLFYILLSYVVAWNPRATFGRFARREAL